MGPVSHGKSLQLLGRVLFELGRDPSARIAYVAPNADRASRFVDTVRRYIQESEALRRIFPALGPGAIWRQDGFAIARPGGSRHESLRALGARQDIG